MKKITKRAVIALLILLAGSITAFAEDLEITADDILAEGVLAEEGMAEETPTVKESFASGLLLASKGKIEEADVELSTALLLDPQNPIIKDLLKVLTDVEDQVISKEVAVYLFKGMHFGKKRLFIKEGAYYDKALKLAPLYAPLFLYRGRSLQMAGNPTEAIEDYTRAIDIDPKCAFAYYTRGLAFKKAELFDLALEDYNRAIELEEGFAMAYNNRAFLYFVIFEDKATGCADWQKTCELGICKNYNMAVESGDCL
jgi:tetratricopeptide (TPR) repeat protein